jgi:nitric oxide reductase subunit B
MQTEILQFLRWFRTVGDVVFIVGALAITWQVVKGVFFPTLAPVSAESGESAAASRLSA